MNIFQPYPLCEEVSDESSGSLGGGGETTEEQSSESATPSFFLRDLTEDDAYETLKSAREFPDHLSALESRLSERVSPVSSRLDEIQRAMQSRTTVNPKLEKLQKVLEGYDPALAKEFLPALIEDLQGSIQSSPLDGTALEPHLSPYMQRMQEQFNRDLTMGLLDAYDINVDEIIPPVEGDKWAPTTQAHKSFIKWYSLQDGPTQRSLSAPGLGFAQAMNKFKKWNMAQVKEKEQTMESASARLESGQQPKAAGRRQAVRTLDDEFEAGVQSVLAEYKR
jgi:hypothetical protein